jgi:hypothetical protein
VKTGKSQQVRLRRLLPRSTSASGESPGRPGFPPFRRSRRPWTPGWRTTTPLGPTKPWSGHARRGVRLRLLAKGEGLVPVDSREDHRGQWVLRWVGSNGMVSADNQPVSVTNAYKGELVDVFVDGSVIQVWSKNHLIRIVARSRARVPKVRADGLTCQGSADYEPSSISWNLTGGTQKALVRSESPAALQPDVSRLDDLIGAEALDPGQRVVVLQRAEVQPRQGLDPRHRHLVGLELAERELQVGDQVGLGHYVGRGAQAPSLSRTIVATFQYAPGSKTAR